MVNTLLSVWMLAWAIVLPVSIAASSLLYFPLLGFYVLLARWSFPRWPPQGRRLELAFTIFWMLSVASAIANPDPWHCRFRLGKDLYFLSLVLLGAYLSREPRGPKLLRVFMISAVGTAFFGIVQRLIGVNQSDHTGGVFWAMPTWLAHAPRWILDHLSMVHGRVVGTRAHPLTYAEGLLFPLGYTLAGLTEKKESWWRWAIAQYLVVLGLVVSQSRGPWIAAVVMVGGVILLYRNARLMKRLALIYVPVALCFLAPSLRDRVHSISNTTYEPNAERFEMWQAGHEMVKDHPLLGIGPGNMNLISPLYQSEKRRLDGPWGHLHDTYVNVSAERGLLGLGAFFFLLYALASELWVGYRAALERSDESAQRILLTALLSLAGWFVAGFTETIYHDSNVLMMFYFVMGIAVATSRGLRFQTVSR